MSQPVDSNHASEETLITYSLGSETIEEATAQHIGQCKTCMSEVTEVRSLQRALKKKLTRFDCPSAEMLTAYALGEIPPWARAEVWNHLHNCPRCTEEVQVTQQAYAMLFSPHLWQTMHRVVASLVLNPQYSVRDIEDDGMLPQMFQSFLARDIEVNLGRYEVERGKFLLTGRIHQKQAATSTSSPTPLAVRLLRINGGQPPELIDETPPGPDNFFELAPVPPGTYQLEVLLSDRLVEKGVLKL